MSDLGKHSELNTYKLFIYTQYIEWCILLHVRLFQSGSLLQPWGFFRSKAQLAKRENDLRGRLNCAKSQCLYDCLRDVPLNRIFENFNTIDHGYHPFADGDFIPADIVETGNYNLSKRSASLDTPYLVSVVW